MSESQSRYSIVERLTQTKLDIMTAKSTLKEEPQHKEQRIAELKKDVVYGASEPLKLSPQAKLVAVHNRKLYIGAPKMIITYYGGLIMELVARVQKLLRGKQPDTLMAVIIPKKILTDKSYKRPNTTVDDNHKNYFDSCALDLGRAIVDVYGASFNAKTIQKEGATDYVFTRGKTSITYSLRGADRWKSSGGDKWSNDVTGILAIQEPHLDLQRAGALLRASLDTYLLDYRHGTFGVVYHKSDFDESLKGIPLLKEIGVKPTEAAEFVSVMMYGGYVHKEFAEGELTF